MTRFFGGFLAIVLATACSAPSPDRPDFSIAQPDIKSGLEFLTPETQSQQKDAFANPGYLWAEKGEALFNEMSAETSCASCHKNAKEQFLRLADRYPGIDQKSGTLINIEGRINLCRLRYQAGKALDYESEDLLALTTFVNGFGRGLPINYEVTNALRPHFENGKSYFYIRRGQLNLSCHQCHDQNWGQKMRGDTVSQGHINGFPTYRNDWQSLGSSHRRFEACDIGVRAEPLPLGAQTYIDLEVYLKARGNGLSVETPSIRR